MTPYTISPLAQSDIDAIWEYVAADNPRAADRLLERFLDRFLMLASQPLLGEVRPELGPDLRSFSVGNYVIYYEPTAKRICILRVLHGARDVQTAFGETTGE